MALFCWSRRSLLPLLAIASLTTALNLQLPQVQSIVGFSATCFNAYNTRLPDCSLADFLGAVGGRNLGCSVSCISQLTQLQPVVQGACQGERAGRDTVIGQMFLGTVTEFLCGGDVGDGDAPPSTTTSVTSMSSATTSMSTAAPAESTTTSDSTTTDTTTTASETSTTTAAPSSSETTESSATSTAQATQTAGAGQGGGDNVQTTFEGAGGGSPFDGGPGEFDSAASALSTHSMALVFVGVALLVAG